MTNDNSRTHRAPMPAPQITDPTTRPFAAPTEEPCLSYAIDDQHDASRSKCAKRTRSQTTILARNTPSRPDYRTAACSGFAASAAPAPSLKASFRWSPPPRSARLHDPTVSSCLAPPNAGLLQPPEGPLAPVASPVLQITAPDNDASAAAEPLLNTLLSYNHCNWEQAAPSRRQTSTKLSLYTNSRQAPTPGVVTAASNMFITPWQQY